MVRAHREVFGEALATDADYLDAFVTRLAPDGHRLGTPVVSTAGDEQLYALRGARRGAYALGRSERWNEAGTGFDALVAHVAADDAVALRTLDVDRGDVAFDVAEVEGDDVVVAGASGYWQNPYGASISEESQSFVRAMRRDGGVSPLPVPNDRRHNEARFVLPVGEGGYVVGGMLDGPGTHSADGDATLLRARDFVSLTAAR